MGNNNKYVVLNHLFFHMTDSGLLSHRLSCLVMGHGHNYSLIHICDVDSNGRVLSSQFLHFK